MAIVQSVRGQRELTFRIEDDKIGIVTGRNFSFTLSGAGKLCRLFGHPRGDIAESEAAPPGLRPNNGERR